jgi:hypothetical protein
LLPTSIGPMASCREIAIFFNHWALSIWFSIIILLFIGQLDATLSAFINGYPVILVFLSS